MSEFTKGIRKNCISEHSHQRKKSSGLNKLVDVFVSRS